MTTLGQALSKEAEILKTCVTTLYLEFFDKIDYILDNNNNISTINIIEELRSNLNNEIIILENKYKSNCIKILKKYKQ